MAQWLYWGETGQPDFIRHLPPHLEGRDVATLAQMGYHQRVTREPEDFIPRFPRLLGTSRFEKLPDGRVLETFPEADFSVAAVRGALEEDLRQDAQRELAKTDWYVVRSYELNKKIPKDVIKLRGSIRQHVDWVIDDIAKKSARELVDYRWVFPTAPDQINVNGLPTTFVVTPPGPPPPPMPGDLDPTDRDAVPPPETEEVVELVPPPPPPKAPVLEAPPTTDGPVQLWVEGEDPPPHLDANGIPLITAYAPRVEDTGRTPDQEK